MKRPPAIQLAARRASWLPAAVCLLLLAGAGLAHGRRPLQLPQPVQPVQPVQAQGTVWLAASDRTLDKMRGGFDLGGLVVSFGISRAVYINGQLITSTSLQVGDLSRLTPTQAATLGQQMATHTQLVQNGPGNTLDAGALTIPLATYIQNTLNNQTIHSQTVIQATSNGLSMVKNMNLQSTINQAIANAAGNR
jgi:hypothetical protein